MAYNTTTAAALGLNNVNNTSDANKPISTATQTALNQLVSLTGNTSMSGNKTFTGNLILNGGLVINRKALPDANYSATTTDNYLAYTGLSTNRTVTLALASSVPAGFSVTVKDAAKLALTNNITIVPTSTDTIDKVSSYILNLAGESITFISDGISNWELI